MMCHERNPAPGGSLYSRSSGGSRRAVWRLSSWRVGHGSHWRGEWNARDARDAQAKADNEFAQRTIEQDRQLSLNKAIQDGQRTIDQATADAAIARAAADGLRVKVNALAARLAASQAGGHSCTAATSAAATRAVLVLADVLKRADQRAGELARYAQDSHARGMTCEQA